MTDFAIMNPVQVTQLRWAGKNLRTVGRLAISPDQIIAAVDMDQFSVLYFSTGEKVIVKEPMTAIERLSQRSIAHRHLVKRFKRDLRECKTRGVPVDQAFAMLWEEVALELHWAEAEIAELYDELLDWTKRWLR